jgi:hypothetical protein
LPKPSLLPLLSQVVSKLGLLDTSRTAWESDDHDTVWKGLKNDYELESRFENLIKKVGRGGREVRLVGAVARLLG